MTNIGKCREHNAYFNDCRNRFVNEVTLETNNLIIRLDKLINHISIDDSSKREFEKSVVSWSLDSEFSKCRVCHAKFSITKRRHHCRLCGKIMCHNCSRFLSHTSARKLTGPVVMDGSAAPSDVALVASRVKAGLGEKRSLSLIPREPLHFVHHRTGRIFDSLMGGREAPDSSSSRSIGNESNERLRICQTCKHLLERRERAMDLRTSQFVFVDIYNRLYQLLTEICTLAPTYEHMADSLNCGKTVFSLRSAIELRRKMLGIQREISSLSDRIEKWGVSEEVDDPVITKRPGVREICLQKNIKISVVSTLHDVIATLPDLPTQEAYDRLVKAYCEREEHRAQFASNPALSSAYTGSRDDRLTSPMASTSADQHAGAMLEAGGGAAHRLRNSASLSVLKTHVIGAVASTAAGSVGTNANGGWVSSSPFSAQPPQNHAAARRPPVQAHNAATNASSISNGGRRHETPDNAASGGGGDEEMDVIQQQYLNIKSYLLQAAQAGRLEEVEILEQNLLNLELELRRKNLPTPHLAS